MRYLTTLLFTAALLIVTTATVVGATSNFYQGSTRGSAYLFDNNTGQQIAELLPSDGAEDNQFGWSVAIDGTTAIIGAPASDDYGSYS